MNSQAELAPQHFPTRACGRNLGEFIKDRPAFAADVLKLLDTAALEVGFKQFQEIREAKVKEVKIDGRQAKGGATFPGDDGKKGAGTICFKLEARSGRSTSSRPAGIGRNRHCLPQSRRQADSSRRRPTTIPDLACCAACSAVFGVGNWESPPTCPFGGRRLVAYKVRAVKDGR
ncbi:MAG: hypothetical protein L0Y72_21060 [Gemmataceae bacterium]|nr:hypothetical protein [Gemmataceae bacterium]